MDLQNLTEEEQRVYDKVTDLQNANRKDGMRLSTVGVQFNVSEGRLELLLKWLTDSGLMSRLDRLKFELEYEESMERSIRKAYQEIQQAQAQQALSVPQKPRLIVPGRNNEQT